MAGRPKGRGIRRGAVIDRTTTGAAMAIAFARAVNGETVEQAARRIMPEHKRAAAIRAHYAEGFAKPFAGAKKGRPPKA